MLSKDLQKFQEIVALLIKAEKTEPVISPIAPDELSNEFNLALNEGGMKDEDLYRELEKLSLKTPKTASNKFFNQLYGGRRSKAVLADLLASFLNTSMYTYKIAGPMVGVEKEVVRKIIELAGYGSNGDGTIAAGGSMGNFMAMVIARDAKLAKVRTIGVHSKMTLYTSADCHYSIEKNAALIGIGREQVRYIETDSQGKLIPIELDKQIQEDINLGFTPFMINATAGTTVLGAFDPIIEISQIAKKHQLWLHVDGAYCGGVIFSKKYNHLIKGLELTNSFSLNAHKMLGTPLTCTVLVVKDRKTLVESFSSEANYLYQSEEDQYNLGKTSFQCGRRNDALKLWTLWKSVGTQGLSDMINHQFELADVARNYVKSNPDYTLYSFDDSISICFNYKNIPAKTLCAALYNNAQIMVSYGQFKEQTFVRLVTVNSDNSKVDLLNFFQSLESFVKENEESLLAIPAIK